MIKKTYRKTTGGARLVLPEEWIPRAIAADKAKRLAEQKAYYDALPKLTRLMSFLKRLIA